MHSLSMWLVALPLAFALPQTLSTATTSAASSTGTSACNNSPALCSRSYGNITHLGAHDSPFVANSSNKFTSSGNQFYTSTTQLDAGVRLLSAQIHTANDSDTTTPMHLCHSDCGLYDAGLMVDWLGGIKTWLDNNPNEVVTLLLVNSINVDASRLNTDFTRSGINKYAYAPTSSSGSWPTLQSLIDANSRLVVFIASLSSNTGATYLLDEFTYVFENPFEVTSTSNFSCSPDRPTSLQGNPSAAASSGRLFLMNHFLDQAQLFSIETPNVDASSSTNSPDPSIVGSLGSAAQQCTTTYGKAPNFVLVDWFNVGPAISTVDTLNGVTGNVVGRKDVSSSILSQQASGSASDHTRHASVFALAVGLVVALGGWI